MFRPSSLGTFSRRHRLAGLLFACGVLFALFSFGGIARAATNPAVSFANTRWNCLTADCATRVKQGAAQPNYECAEFVARALAYADDMPGLNYYASQSDFEYYQPGDGKTYDLLLITPVSGYHTLADFLLDYGWGNVGPHLNGAVAGDVVVFDDNGIPEHTVIISVMGASTSSTKIDAHNNARYDYPLSDEISGFDSWYILHFYGA